MILVTGRRHHLKPVEIILLESACLRSKPGFCQEKLSRCRVFTCWMEPFPAVQSNNEVTASLIFLPVQPQSRWWPGSISVCLCGSIKWVNWLMILSSVVALCGPSNLISYRELLLCFKMSEKCFVCNNPDKRSINQWQINLLIDLMWKVSVESNKRWHVGGRMNGAVIKGYEDDVGSRTSVYLHTAHSITWSLHRHASVPVDQVSRTPLHRDGSKPRPPALTCPPPPCRE